MKEVCKVLKQSHPFNYPPFLSPVNKKKKKKESEGEKGNWASCVTSESLAQHF